MIFYYTTLDSKNIQFIYSGIIDKDLADRDFKTIIAMEPDLSRKSINSNIKRITIIKRNTNLVVHKIYDTYT